MEFSYIIHSLGGCMHNCNHVHQQCLSSSRSLEMFIGLHLEIVIFI